MKTSVELRAKADCPSHSRAYVGVRDLVFVIDEPVERGGANMGPTPTDMALAALIGCMNVIGHKCADRLGVDIGHLAIDASCAFDRRGVTLDEEVEVPFQSIILVVKSSGGASAEDLRRVGAEVEKYCPLSKLFGNAGTNLEVSWRND
ncbi:OsmC family protein [Pelagibius litoralis]|nr:OsmC family protein [Pelagibius litoralis]